MNLRQLVPTVADVDPVVAHATASRPAPPDRPWVLVNMVVSLDGATAVDGLSGSLGGEADKVVFSAIRAVGDVILAGATTVRDEGYGPPRTPPSRQAERLARGQKAFPRLAVVTGSLDLDPTSTMFTEAVEPPLVYTTTDADPTRRAALAEVAEVVTAGTGSVDLRLVVAHLFDLGVGVVVCEGGPALNRHLFEADLVDELDITTAPALVGGDSARVVQGATPGLAPMALAHLWEDAGVLLARYVRA